jgi:hypothetical protein
MKAKLDGTPVKFEQPFLCLRTTTKNVGCVGDMYIDVGGKVKLYINNNNKPTSKLIELCKLLASRGHKVTHFGTYEGSAGPNYILKCGALFTRWGKFETGEGKEIKKFKTPEYLRHW